MQMGYHVWGASWNAVRDTHLA